MQKNNLSQASDKRELQITRVFDAPVEAVWKAWTDAKQLAQWWGPREFTNPVCEIDARPGGKIYIEMKGPDGTVYPMNGAFQEISPPNRLVFTSAALDENGKPVLEVLTTVTFEKLDGKTKLILKASVTKVIGIGYAYLEGMEDGWSQSLDRLAEIVE